MVKIDGHDDAVIGPAMVWGQDGSLRCVLVYNAEKIREKMMKRDGMSFEDAREYIEFNIEAAYTWPHTVILVWPEDQWDQWEEDDE